jgi:hypothetical protein
MLSEASLKITKISIPVACAILLVASAKPADAKDWQQQHPRRAEVLRRDNNINNRINNNYGNLNGHYGQLERQDWQVRRQEQSDARANGGYITRGQQGQLNREERSMNQEIRMDNTNNPFVQNHPRRAEVLGRDANLNYSINKDEGHLDGQYKNLEAEDRGIRQQEQSDARANGGYITRAEKMQLNQEENCLRNQIQQDHNGGATGVVTGHPIPQPTPFQSTPIVAQ